MTYYQAAQKLWKPGEQDQGQQPEYLAIPVLNCIALSFEIGLKGLLVAKGEAPETFQRRYGHRLIKLWESQKIDNLRENAEVCSVSWTYPSHWPGTGSNFEDFESTSNG